MISRLNLLLSTFLAAATIVYAQRPDSADVEQLSPTKGDSLIPEWLQHGDPRERAWAAYWISRDRRQQNVPQLIDTLSAYQASPQAASSGWSEDDQAAFAVLDALIQLQAEISPDSAEALYPKFPVAALALIAQSHADTSEALMRILNSTESWGLLNWLTIADLLAANPPPGFAVRLLRNISIHARVQVLSPGQGFPGVGIAGDCAGSTEGAAQAGWPPVGAYRLAAHSSSTSRPLVGGEDPVYLLRTPSQDYWFADHASDDCADLMGVTLSDLSRDLIGQLLNAKKDAFALQLDPVLNVTWTSPKSYAQEVSAFVLQQQKVLQDTERGLESRSLLTAAEAASAAPSLDVEILDCRTIKTPLPDLVFADPSIHVVDQHREAVD